jgi:uncharacterized protein YfaS (alpha-2-macroglobulin family)
MMRGKQRVGALAALVLLAGVTITWLMAANKAQEQTRDSATRAYNAGNYKDAYQVLHKLALDPKNDPMQVGKDLDLAVQCQRQLGNVDEIDDFRETVIAAHAKNWRLLQTAALSYASVDHYGYIVAGKFYRGYKRGGGRWVNTLERDRTRALQLMQQALPLVEKDGDKKAVADFHLHFARLLLNGAGWHEPWRLQYLTDLGTLPDYEDGYRYYHGQSSRGAPVDENGNPIYHHKPKSYDTAKSDGERWRWMLARAAELDPNRSGEVDMMFANFLHSQFGVASMGGVGFGFRNEEDDRKNESGTFALHTLKDNETIARLATGIKRFGVPDEFNFLKVCERVATSGKSQYGAQARDLVARELEDRRQYPRAASAWKKSIEEYGPGDQAYRQKRLDQLIGNWGRFEPLTTQPAGTKATIDFRFRNGKKVSFEAIAIKVPQLLADVKAYLKSKPARLDWQKINIGNLGYRLVEQNEQQYLGDKVASWDEKLTPRPEHIDDRITVTTPLLKPGAYLLRAQMENGNLSRIIVWLDDTILVKKQLNKQVLYYVADAATGHPVARANVEFVGYRSNFTPPNTWNTETLNFNEDTDGDGQVILGENKMPQGYSWVAIARKAKDGQGGADRFAHLGFTGVWYSGIYDPEYNATRVFTITDRPVYRPKHTVQFKAWVRHARYDQADTSDFADKTFTVRIHNPKGDKVYEKELTTDAYAGLVGEYPVPSGATLGTYGLAVLQGDRYLGGGSFRVEEYKKPEFEVIVEAPKEPVQLGETIQATVKAKYYFGAPVTSARVKYKVLRTSHEATWYPRGRWDWFYGPGYWWFASDYVWFPGWREWGCKRPIPPWWGRGHEPPEVVLENEVPIGPDGTVSIAIDTAPAKALHGDQDHKYSITAEVVDESRRMIPGTGDVLVARKPFKVYAWVDRGHYRAGDTIKSSFRAQTLDGKPVQGEGQLTLFKISYDKANQPVETAVQKWGVDTDVEGYARQQMTAARAGQYRLSFRLTDAKKHTIEGGYLFVVRGEGFTGLDYRFNDLELVTDRREYAPKDKVKLLINTNQNDGVVLLFARPAGVYQAPKVIRLQGKSTEQDITVSKKDMPNFYVEALTIHHGHVYTEVREVVVPPEKRVLNVEVLPSQKEYKPGEKATVKVKVTDFFGKPFVGALVVSMYDRSVEFISGGSNVPEIREFFWKWRRHHYPQTEASVGQLFYNLVRHPEIGMSNLGVFGETVVEELRKAEKGKAEGERGAAKNGAFAPQGLATASGGFAGRSGGGRRLILDSDKKGDGKPGEASGEGREQQAGEKAPATPGGQEPTVRKNFADTAYWNPTLVTDQGGIAEVGLTMPENLTGWKVKAWALGHGTKVGEGAAEVVTKKDLLVRLQAPRFFVQKDEVVLSANVHNYLKKDKTATVTLDLSGATLAVLGEPSVKVNIPAGGEKRVDWRVAVKAEGEAVVRMKAITDEESDAMEMRFPCLVHGMLKTDSFSGVVRPEKESASVTLTVPKERRINESRLEVRYSPTLAGALVDALPYLVEYPYGCTEQTLNRFLPTVITQRILQDMKLDLKAIEKKRTNLNSQEIGDAQARARGWKRFPRNPVFDIDEVKRTSEAGVKALVAMQCSDGGWGWFSGYGEHSWPHTTAVVVHGLQLARDNGVVLPPGVLEAGVNWLKNYQAEQIRRLLNAPSKTEPYKEHADNVDALVYMVLMDAGVAVKEMREFLYRDRMKLSVYAKAMYGLALHKEQQVDKLAMILKNIEQYVVHDEENQTAYLKLPGDSPWWYWYGSEIEADAYYLKLLSRTDAKGKTAPGLVKYLLNNRKHATYWNSTRDTAICIEAMAEYLKASGEDRPDLTVEIWLDGKRQKEVKINAENLFTFDATFVLFGDAVEDGKHTLEVRKKGTGPVYFNAYLTNFTLEDDIKRAGLEVKVNRKYYKLTRVDKSVKVPGSRGQPADQKVEKYKRTELENLASLKSGDLVEVELEIDSKNDYEYLIFEDPKAAGFEALLVRSGYTGNDLGAYVEQRDERVCFFVRALARGKHSVSYRTRAEIPGKFSALPARAEAMYAPELRGNSDEIKLRITD